MWLQNECKLSAKNRGFHLITDEVIAASSDLASIETGLLHLFIKHTSASLSINENADPDVRHDLESHFNHFVPENEKVKGQRVRYKALHFTLTS